MWGHARFNIALPTEVSETWGSLGAGDAACVTATDATALSFVRPPTREVSPCSLVKQHPMSPPPR
eukprot:scaffold92704_cov59-Phaeocystis_antarctica.AAC.3